MRELDSLPASWQAFKEYFLPEAVGPANLGRLTNPQAEGRWRRVVRHNTLEENLMRDLERAHKSNQNISTKSTIQSKNKMESVVILYQQHLRQRVGSWSEQQQNLRGELFERCAASLQPTKRSNQAVPPELLQEGLAKKMCSITPHELLRLCMGNRFESIAVQGYLNSLAAQELNGIIYPFAQNVGSLITHRSGNYIATWLVLRDETFLSACEQYCISSLDKLVTNKCAVKVMQALAGVSKTFCKVFNQYYKLNYRYLRKSKQASIIMNAVILNIDTSPPNSIEYLIERMKNIFNEVRADHHTDQFRLLSSVLQVFSVEKLEDLVFKLMENIGWLAEDRIGNYSVQLLLTEKFTNYRETLTQNLCKERVYSLFASKYKMQILFKLLQIQEASIWYDELLTRAIDLPFSTVLSLISDAAAGSIFLCLLSTTVSPIITKKLEELSSTVEKNKEDHKIIYSSSVEYFAHKLNQILHMLSSIPKPKTDF
jgi:ribosomal protein L20A (L18A)